MLNKDLQASLEVALAAFQANVEKQLDTTNRQHSKETRTQSIEDQMAILAKQFLYGGYINVRGMNDGKKIDRKIYFTAVEFYYHECKKGWTDDTNRITDYIMYHNPDVTASKAQNTWNKKVLPTGGLHIHQSGVDFTFEDPSDKFRASVLIREYVVIDGKYDDNDQFTPETHPTFIKHELLEEVPIHVQGSAMSIQWVDRHLSGKVNIERFPRIRVVECDLAKRKDGTFVRAKAQTKDSRKWQFKRVGKLRFKHLGSAGKMTIRHLGLHDAFNRDAVDIINEAFRSHEVFDSHRFIQLFTRKNHREYVEALSYYLQVLGYKYPINTLHGHIAISLLSVNCIESVGKTKSNTIFGIKRLNEAWRKK